MITYEVQAEARLAEATARLQALKATTASNGYGNGHSSAEAVLAQLRSEVTLLSQRAGAVLPSAAAAAQRTLARREADAAEPARSAEDVEQLVRTSNTVTVKYMYLVLGTQSLAACAAC
jgi:hypothetical protein